METTYRIKRFYNDGRQAETVKTFLTLEEAKEHCQDDDTKGVLPDGVKWFDGFEEE